jgi:hypothetical protein
VRRAESLADYSGFRNPGEPVRTTENFLRSRQRWLFWRLGTSLAA